MRLERAAAMGTLVGIVWASPASAQTVDHVVKPGDTCAAIAARYYGDSRLVDPIHEANPGLGPAPHALAPGKVLKIPPKPAPKAAAPDAKLAYVRNRVEVQTAETRPGKPEDPLFRGNRVATKEASSAGITFRDESQVRVEEQTLVIILGDVRSAASSSKLTGADATLVTGSLRARLSELSGRPPRVVDTPAARVEIGGGEAKVSVDDKKTTRLAVHAGLSSIAAQKQSVVVTSGFGSRADEGKPPTPARPLPPAPLWDGAPTFVLLPSALSDDVHLRYKPGVAFDGVAEWRVQVSRDAAMTDLVVDAKAPKDVTTIALRAIGPGRFFVRVSAIDADAFEGPFSAVHPTTLARVTTEPAGRRAVRVRVEPEDVPCSIDGALAAPLPPSLVVPSAAPRRITCGEGGPATSGAVALPAGRWSPALRALSTTSAGPRGAEIRVALVDGDGAPIDERPVIEGIGGRVDDVRRVDPGVFAVTLNAPPGTRSVGLRARVATGESAEVASVQLPPQVAAAAEEPRARSRAVGIGVGYAFAGGSFVVGGPRLALDGGVSLGRGAERLVLGGLATLERASADDFGGHATSAWTAGIGPSAAIVIERGRVAPYLATGVELAYQSRKTDGVTRTGLVGVVPATLGCEVRLGPGALFGELGYRASFDVAGDDPLSQRGGFGALGSRLRF